MLLSAIHSDCLIRFQESDEFWILGDAFIEAYYTHFDVEVTMEFIFCLLACYVCHIALVFYLAVFHVFIYANNRTFEWDLRAMVNARVGDGTVQAVSFVATDNSYDLLRNLPPKNSR